MSWFGRLKQSFGIGSSQTDEESQPRSIKVSEIQVSSDWVGFASNGLIEGLEFSATLQLKTPLRILTKHGEIHKDRKSPPPAYAIEEWEGVWVPKLDSKFDFLKEGATMSSDIGPIPLDDNELLPFLISVRTVVETSLPIEDRRKKLSESLSETKWPRIASRYGGTASIIDSLFPPFLTTIKGLNKETINELFQANLRTPKALEITPDEILLRIKGIGPSKLKKIRECCVGAVNKNCEWTEST